MPNFIFAFHGGGKPDTPEAGAKMMADWNAWLDGLGDANVDPGNPVGMSKTVSAKGVENNGGSNPLGGYSVVMAKDIDAAVKIAQSCPFVQMGTIEVAEILKM